jgi:elongation factor P
MVISDQFKKKENTMISASDLKAGMTFVNGDKLIRVIEASHHKPGKGNTVMRMKLKDVRSGANFDTTYRPDEKFSRAMIDSIPVQYLYTMDDTAYFMNLETFEQYEIPTAVVADELKYILENAEVKIQFFDTEVIGITLPTTVVLEVVETQPSIKGATVTGSGKPATLETGLVVNVPDFISVGQKLEINTQEGTYIKRA